MRARVERDDFKAKFEVSSAKAETLQKQFDTEQQKHELTCKELNEARATIQKLTQAPRQPPEIRVEWAGEPIRSP